MTINKIFLTERNVYMKRKVLLSLTAILVLCSNSTVFAQTQGYGKGQGRTDSVNINDYSTSDYDRFEYNYEFTSGPDNAKELGRPTSTDKVPTNNEYENVQKNKDVSVNPPPYGVFTGDIPTEKSNPYYTEPTYPNTKETTNYSVTEYDSTGNGYLPSTSLTDTNSNTASSPQPTQNVSINYNTTAYSSSSKELRTAPLYYNDNSIGRLYIPELNRTSKVYEGDSLSNLSKGLGHFSYTSAYDGNVAIAGHNTTDFKNIWKLEKGDTIEYETKYGTRIYRVTSIKKIDDDDFSMLNWTSDNRLTLITCVPNSPTQRYCVTALEK